MQAHYVCVLATGYRAVTVGWALGYCFHECEKSSQIA